MVKSKVLADLKKLQQKCKNTANIETEEATKHSLILPLISALGYDIFDNNEVRPEFIADVGTKRGEKVDYVIMQNGQPMILIEAKQVGTPLRNKTDQLFRYFVATTAKIGVLTDGVKYMFYTDSQKANIMDSEPYMTIDLSKATTGELERLLVYHKDELDMGYVLDNIKYEKFIEVSKKFIMGLLDKQPANWLIRKLADECQINEPDDARLAEIFNNQLREILKGGKSKANEKDFNSKTSGRVTEGAAKLSSEIFKETKGMRITKLTIDGVVIDDDGMSWRELYTYIFKTSTEKYTTSKICELFNKDETRKWVYTEDCEELIKKNSYYIEDKGLYLYQKLSGSDIVKRCIETCDIFGVIDKETVEIEYEVVR